MVLHCPNKGVGPGYVLESSNIYRVTREVCHSFLPHRGFTLCADGVENAHFNGRHKNKTRQKTRFTPRTAAMLPPPQREPGGKKKKKKNQPTQHRRAAAAEQKHTLFPDKNLTFYTYIVVR